MSELQDIFLGDVAAGLKGDSAKVVGEKLNAWFAALRAGLPSVRLNGASANLSFSLREDGAGNLGLFVGPAGAPDGSQILAASFSKTTGRVKFGPPTGDALVTVGSAKPISFYTNPGNEPAVLWRSGDALRFGTTTDGVGTGGFAERVRFHPDGRVSIGSATATAELGLWAMGGDQDCRLQINANGGKAVQFGRSDGLSFIDCGLADPFALYVGGVDVLTVHPHGAFFRVAVAPDASNLHPLGGPGNLWSVVWAQTGTISTSDAREKTPVRVLTEAERAAARDLRAEIGAFQWLDAIEKKGEAVARDHIGMTVQRAIEIMESHGLDPWRYGFICRDEITRKVTVMQTKRVQATQTVDESFNEIEIRDGVPVLVKKTRTVERKLVEMKPVLDEDGEPVMQAGPPVAGEGGELIEQAPQPVMCPVPVMVERPVPVEIDEPAGDRLAFREGQLALFMLAGLADV